MQARQRIQVADHPDTLSSMASLALCRKAQGQSTEAEKLEMMIGLLILNGIEIIEEAVVDIARWFDTELM